MSEHVERSLEHILGVFEQLERIQLFTSLEIREIVKRCQSHEYRLQKLHKNSQDFLHYIQYLTNFLALIKKRRTVANNWFKKAEIDAAVTGKIENIYRRVCERFKNELELWISRVEFAKKRNNFALVSELYLRMLQIHGNRTELWIVAAKWEFEENGSSENARNLLQRAIRLLSQDGKLWRELFRFELLYVEKLLLRQEVLKVEADKMPKAEQIEMAIDLKDDVLELKLAELVFEQALRNVPGDATSKNARPHIEILLDFWRIANTFHFAKDLAHRVFKSLTETFNGIPQVWELKVEKTLDDRRKSENTEVLKGLAIEIDPSKSQRVSRAMDADSVACELYEEAVQLESMRNNSEMWHLYLNFLIRRVEVQPELSEELAANRHQKIHQVFQRMNDMDLVSVNDCLKIMNIFEHSSKEFGDICDSALCRYPTSVEIWLEILNGKIQKTLASEEDFRNGRKEVLKTFNRAVKKVPEVDALPIWELGVNWTTLTEEVDKVKELFEVAIRFPPQVSDKMKEKYLEWTFVHCPSAEVRSLFHRMALMQPNPTGLYQKFVHIEMARENSTSLVESTNSELVRKAFELGLSDCGTRSSQLWLDYMDFETTSKLGLPENVSTLYQRAIKRLNEAELGIFIETWSLQKAGNFKRKFVELS